MIDLVSHLPDGRRGQMLAVAMLLVAILLVWVSILSPLLGWYEGRDAALAQQRQLAAHMVALGQEIPALRDAVKAAKVPDSGDQVLLQGGTDAIAGANLQSALQNLATQAGTNLDSAALQPAQQTGALRRIGMQVSVTATWPVLIAFLQSIETAQPSMVVSDIAINSANSGATGAAAQVQANFTVSGFSAESGQ